MRNYTLRQIRLFVEAIGRLQKRRMVDALTVERVGQATDKSYRQFLDRLNSE